MRFSPSRLDLSELFSRWVHPSIPVGSKDHDSHSHFIGATLAAGATAIVCFPALLIAEISMSPAGLLAVVSLIAYLGISAGVSKTGRLEAGKNLALSCLAVFLTMVCLQTGGSGSPFLIALCVLPLEAVLWRGNRGAIFGTLAALTSLAAILLTTSGNAATSAGSLLGYSAQIWVVGIILIYVASVAYRVQNWQRTAQSAIERQRTHFTLVSENSNQLLTQHDRNGSTLFVTGAARPLLGAGSKELLGNGLFERIHLQDRIAFLKSISDAAQQMKEQRCTLRIRFRGEGDRLWKQVEAVCHPSRNSATGQVNVACAMTDISKQLELQSLLDHSAKKADEVHQAQRRFFATMSHELRTPLNAIVGFSDILQQDLFGKLPFERHREYVNIIQDSGQHLLSVVNDLLDISRIEAGKYELSLSTFSLTDSLVATVKMLQPDADKGNVKVQVTADDALPEITGDRRACQQILINVDSNAIKFTPNGGAVHVSARQFGRSIKLVVKDNGIGISPESLEKIGQPFVQVEAGNDRKFEGSGLGLSIVKGLVDLHKGDLQIQSIEGSGTIVSIKIPIKATVSQPVPGDNGSQLVHLNKKSNKVLAATKSVSSSVSKGDRRARLSA